MPCAEESKKAEREDLPLTPSTEGLAKACRERLVCAQRYSSNLKGYSSIFNINHYIIVSVLMVV